MMQEELEKKIQKIITLDRVVIDLDADLLKYTNLHYQKSPIVLDTIQSNILEIIINFIELSSVGMKNDDEIHKFLMNIKEKDVSVFLEVMVASKKLEIKDMTDCLCEIVAEDFSLPLKECKNKYSKEG